MGKKRVAPLGCGVAPGDGAGVGDGRVPPLPVPGVPVGVTLGGLPGDGIGVAVGGVPGVIPGVTVAAGGGGASCSAGSPKRWKVSSRSS